MEKYKTCEEIRQSLGVTQKKFAQMVGSTLRTYQARLDGSQPKWLVAEIVKASSYNNGKVCIETIDGSYNITVEKVG